MATPLGGRFYHVFTKRSTENIFVVRIPKEYKVLSGGVRGHGATGILASFYDANERAWVVHHEPVDDDAAVLLQVVTLVDPDDMYDVSVFSASITDGMGDADVAALKQNTNEVMRSAWDPISLSGTPAAVLLRQQRRRRQQRRNNMATVKCRVADGYIMTGGGFMSGYPVLLSAPVQVAQPPHSVRSINPDGSCHFSVSSALNRHDNVRGSSHACVPVGTQSDSTALEPNTMPYSEWSVTAADSVTLTCYAIGIRCREHHSDSDVPVKMDMWGSHSTNTTKNVKVHHRPGGRWGIELPPPHGKFYFSFAVSTSPSPLVMAEFYK